jgi:hypothetical protein
MATRLSPSVIARIVVSGLLFWAVAKHRYGFYQLVRFLVTATAAYSAVVAYDVLTAARRRVWVWCLLGLALLFNPFVPIAMDRPTWQVVDVAAGLVFLASVFAFSEAAGSGRPPGGDPAPEASFAATAGSECHESPIEGGSLCRYTKRTRRIKP